MKEKEKIKGKIKNNKNRNEKKNEGRKVKKGENGPFWKKNGQ